MKVIMMGDIADAIAQTVAQALSGVDETVLGAIIREGMPERGIVIEASREELQNLPNVLYSDVEVKPTEGGAR